MLAALKKELVKHRQFKALGADWRVAARRRGAA
jgi:hypothetical protein